MKKYFTMLFVFSFTLLFLGFVLFATSLKTVAEPQNYSRIHASHILVDEQIEAQKLKTRIDKGEDFSCLAKKYSKCPSGLQGGNLGYFERGEMVSSFEEAAFSLPKGEVSEPVKTKFGWHLIKILDKK